MWSGLPRPAASGAGKSVSALRHFCHLPKHPLDPFDDEMGRSFFRRRTMGPLIFIVRLIHVGTIFPPFSVDGRDCSWEWQDHNIRSTELCPNGFPPPPHPLCFKDDGFGWRTGRATGGCSEWKCANFVCGRECPEVCDQASCCDELSGYGDFCERNPLGCKFDE